MTWGVGGMGDLGTWIAFDLQVVELSLPWDTPELSELFK